MKAKLSALILLEFFLFISSGLAATNQPSGNWFLVKKNGEKSSVYFETAETNKKNNSLSITQTWQNTKPEAAKVIVKTVSVNDKSFSPAWLEVSYLSKDGKKEFRLRTVATEKKQIKSMKTTFERLKPKYEKTEDLSPLPIDAIFFTTLPRYLAKLESGFYTSRVIMDDIEEAKLETRILRIRRMDEKKIFLGIPCFRSSVDLNGFDSDFWVSSDGALCDFHALTMGLQFTRISKAEAEKINQ